MDLPAPTWPTSLLNFMEQWVPTLVAPLLYAGVLLRKHTKHNAKSRMFKGEALERTGLLYYTMLYYYSSYYSILYYSKDREEEGGEDNAFLENAAPGDD